jgi:hypothetical protein
MVEKITKMSDEDLVFVRKYCLGGTFPASDERCLFSKAKLLVNDSNIDQKGKVPKEADTLFLCRYPDKNMPMHKAILISELNECPSPERREKIDSK